MDNKPVAAIGQISGLTASGIIVGVALAAISRHSRLKPLLQQHHKQQGFKRSEIKQARQHQ